MFFPFSNFSFLSGFQRRRIKAGFESMDVLEKNLNQRMGTSKFKHDWYKSKLVPDNHVLFPEALWKELIQELLNFLPNEREFF